MPIVSTSRLFVVPAAETAESAGGTILAEDTASETAAVLVLVIIVVVIIDVLTSIVGISVIIV